VTYSITFQIERLPALNTGATRRGRFAQAAEAKRWTALVGGHVMRLGRPKRPLQRSCVRLVRHSSRQPDYDNMVISAKPIVDGLVRAGVLADDRPANFVGGHPEYVWEKTKRAEKGFITVEVTERGAS